MYTTLNQSKKTSFDTFELPRSALDEINLLKQSNLQNKHILKRQSLHITREVWRFLKNQFSSSTVQPSTKLSQQEILNLVSDMTLLLQTKIIELGRIDGEAERLINQFDDIREEMEQKIEALQNPIDCNTSKFIVVYNEKLCGFACKMHHWSYCFSVAFALNRTFYMKFGPEYPNFRPVTSCNEPVGDFIYLTDYLPHYHIIKCPFIDGVNFPYLPQSIPYHVGKKLEAIHGAPFVWYIGHLQKYIFRFYPSDFLLSVNENIKILRDQPTTNRYRQPIAGVHVRRTDKINTEASFHNLDEYMVHVERFFKHKAIEQTIAKAEEKLTIDSLKPVSNMSIKPTVYLASDDPSVIIEAKLKYPHYRFVGNQFKSNHTRGTLAGNKDIIMDVLMLSNTDFLSCTFSSQVCRLAYELMQTHYNYLIDASDCFESLDDLYYFGGQQLVVWKPMMDSVELGLKLGDKLKIYGNHWDGFALTSKINHLEKQTLLPAYLFYQTILWQ